MPGKSRHLCVTVVIIMKFWPFKKAKNSIENPETPLSNPAQWLLDMFGGGPTYAGVQVTETTAIRSTAVYACVSLIAQSVASLPLLVYERRDSGRRVATEHDYFALLHDQPNAAMTATVFRELLMTHLLLSGNAYAAIWRDKANRAVELLPVHPHSVRVERVKGRLRYRITLQEGGEEVLDQGDMLHIPGLGFDGLKGLSPISAVAKQAVGLALATEEHGARFFKNAAQPSGVLLHPGKISPEAAERLKRSFAEAHSGLSNTGKAILLEEGMKWEQVTMSAQDAQYLETRRFQVAEIARVFRVPLHMIQETEKSTSWGTGIEQQSIGFVMYTLRPWLVRLEQEINRKLFVGSRRLNRYYAEHNVSGLLRGDAKARKEYYAGAITNAWMTPNEVRRLENLPPIKGGDKLFIQSNMVPVDQLAARGAGSPPGESPPWLGGEDSEGVHAAH